MKKIGLVTSSAGLIFLGIWMILKQNNPLLAAQMFKWWPLLFILLGIEILMQFSNKNEGERVGTSFLIVPVIIIFLFINVFQGFWVNLDKGFGWLSKDLKLNKSGFSLIFRDDWRVLEATKLFEDAGSQLEFTVSNADIRLVKSNDKSFRLETKVHVDRDSSINKYEIQSSKTENGYRITMKENYIRGIEAVLYVPQDYSVKIDGDNVQIKSSDNSLKTAFDADISNGNIDVTGDIERSTINLTNGRVNISNTLSKDINIDVKNGLVVLSTEDPNLQAKLEVNLGPCQYNDDKSINSGLQKSIGTGTDNLYIKVGNGSIRVQNQE